MIAFHRTRTVAAVCVLSGALLCAGGCAWLGLEGLVTTRIEVRSATQSLREQVFGAYDELEEEVYVLAGVRSVDPLTGQPTPPAPMTQSRRRALAARRGMEFNRDDVLRFKRSGYVGERADGLLEVLVEEGGELHARDPWLYSLVLAVTEEENANRRSIAHRIIEITPELQGEDGLQMLEAIMAEKHRHEAQPGMKLQEPDGTWVTKGEGEGGG